MGDKIIINTLRRSCYRRPRFDRRLDVTGFALGLLQTLGAVFYPQINDTLIFIVMVVVLLVRPSGLFGSPAHR